MKTEVVYGPPGTGKSTYLIGKMREFIDSGIDPNRIGLVSFTKAAANELADRIGVKRGGNIATTHSYCFRIIGASRDQVVGPAQLADFSKRTGILVTGRTSTDGVEYSKDGDFYMALDQYHRATMSQDLGRTYMDSSRLGSFMEFSRFCDLYKRWKSSHGYIDYQDMIEAAVDGETPDLDVLFVDEAQDLSKSQWKLIQKWAESIPTVIVAGDDDQAIYEWSGADPHGMADFEATTQAKRTVLIQSHRVPAPVQREAQRVVRLITTRVDKEYMPRASTGRDSAMTRVNAFTQVAIKPDEQTFVLYRTHSMRKEAEEYLIRRRIPFSGTSSPLSGKTIRAIKLLARAKENWERMGGVGLDHGEFTALTRSVEKGWARVLTGGTPEEMDAMFKLPWTAIICIPWPAFKRYMADLERTMGDVTKIVPNVHLMTIHASKGREADHVIVINDVPPRVQEGWAVNPDQEMRTFYVAMTRAKRKLTIVMGKSPLLGV